MRTEISEENIRYWMGLHGYVPWTVTIADLISKGAEVPLESIPKHLFASQDKIDRLTEEVVALKTEKALKEANAK